MMMRACAMAAAVVALLPAAAIADVCASKVNEMAQAFIREASARGGPSLKLVGVKTFPNGRYGALMARMGSGGAPSVALYAIAKRTGWAFAEDCQVLRHEAWTVSADLKPIRSLGESGASLQRSAYPLRSHELIVIKDMFDKSVLPGLDAAVAALNRRLGYASGLGFESRAIPLPSRADSACKTMACFAQDVYERRGLGDGFEFAEIPAADRRILLEKATLAAIEAGGSLSQEAVHGRQTLGAAIEQALARNPGLRFFAMKGWDCVLTWSHLMAVDGSTGESLWLGGSKM